MQQVGTTYRSIWRISYPIIIGLVAQNLMVVIDTAFLGRLGEVTLGAAAIGGIFYLSLIMLGSGFSVGTQIMIGRRNGEGKYRAIGRIFDHAIYFMAALAVVLFAAITWLAPAFLSWFISSPGVLEESLLFLGHRRFGFLFAFLVLTFNGFYVGVARTMVLSVSTIIMATVNVILDYGLIFGNLGLPQMGIAGAALATNIAEFVTFIFLVFWSWKSGSIRFFRLFQFFKPRMRLYRRLFRLAVPVMFQYFLSFSAWFTFFMIIEQISETALAASNIARSYYMLLMIPVWGLSSATSSLVSNIIGQGRVDEVIPLLKKILLISVTANLIVVQSIIFFPHQIAGFFTQDPVLIEVTVKLFYITAMALVAFSVGMVIFSAVSGTGKTMVALRIEILCIAFYLITAFGLAVVFEAQAHMVWLVEVVYFSIMGLFSMIYLRIGNWKSMVV
jgi:putative MATE family efflux protein